MMFQVVQTDWLAFWSTNSNNRTGDELKAYNSDGLSRYVVLSVSLAFFYGLATVAAVYGEINSAIKFHKLLLSKVLKLSLFFFDKTPIGSIINRFSKDMDTVDHVRNYIINNF